MPFATPVQNLRAVAEMVHDEYGREVAKRTIIAKTVESASKLELPDFENDPRIFVDVVTLDSAPTLNGASISIDGTSFNGGQANVYLPDLVGSNGVLHIIDGVLLPPSN